MKTSPSTNLRINFKIPDLLSMRLFSWQHISQSRPSREEWRGDTQECALFTQLLKDKSLDSAAFNTWPGSNLSRQNWEYQCHWLLAESCQAPLQSGKMPFSRTNSHEHGKRNFSSIFLMSVTAFCITSGTQSHPNEINMSHVPRMISSLSSYRILCISKNNILISYLHSHI